MENEILDYEEEIVEAKYVKVSLIWMGVYAFCWIAYDYFLSISKSTDIYTDIYEQIAECFDFGCFVSSMLGIAYLYMSFKAKENSPILKGTILVAYFFMSLYNLLYIFVYGTTLIGWIIHYLKKIF